MAFMPLKSFEGERRTYVVSLVLMIGGLAIAGSFDSKAGGVIVVASWALAVFAIHRMGRAGSTPRK
jgi:hypothetical protein